MPTSSVRSSHNSASDLVAEGREVGRCACSCEERSRPSGPAQRSEEVERRGPLPGLPGGRAVDEPELEISDEVLDALLQGASSAEEIAGPDGVLAHLTRRLLNRALELELSAHLGYEAGQAPLGGVGNARNGRPTKTVLSDQGPLRIRSPRDRNGTSRSSRRRFCIHEQATRSAAGPGVRRLLLRGCGRPKRQRRPGGRVGDEGAL